MQIDKIFSTQFITTDNVILDSLTGVTITIIEIAEDWTTASVVVNNQPCINATHGFYRYYFSEMQDKDYEYYFNPNDTRAIISSGFIPKYSRTIENVWNAQISDYSGSAWSFATKFEQYGWVSHVIDRSSLDAESARKLDEMKKSLDSTKEDLLKIIRDIKPPQVISEWKTTIIK
jgi:hypothetical protein